MQIADFLRASLPYVEGCTIDGVGHLLQIQQPQPVARAIARFLGGNSMTGVVRSDEARIMTTVPPSAR